MGIGKEFFELMEKINYSFGDITYLQTALTHSSYSNEMKSKGFRAESNEALEFLGDSVLQLVISEELFDRYSERGEGALTKIRQSLVCERTLCRVAEGIGLGDYLNVGTGEELSFLRTRPSVLADAMEAVIAALYLDDRQYHNGKSYKSVILGLMADEIEESLRLGDLDYKTMLQQFVEKNNGSVLKYEYSESGPEHAKTFNAVAYINNNRVGEGNGKTKRTAEAAAAKIALGLFGLIKNEKAY